MEPLVSKTDLITVLENFAKCPKEPFKDEDFQKDLQTFAESLFNNFQIKKGNKLYDFLEIEFYIYNEHHKDCITYERTCEAGYWFFHQSGVDISFKSNLKDKKKVLEDKSKITEKEGYGGGILIRSICDDEGKDICGPQKCVDELFDKFNAFGDIANFPCIVERNPKIELNIQPCPRYIKKGDPTIDEKRKKWGFKTEDEMMGFLKQEYRFYDANYSSKLKFNTLETWKDNNNAQ